MRGVPLGMRYPITTMSLSASLQAMQQSAKDVWGGGGGVWGKGWGGGFGERVGGGGGLQGLRVGKQSKRSAKMMVHLL